MRKNRNYTPRSRARVRLTAKLSTHFPWLRPRPRSLLLDAMVEGL